MKKIAVLVLAVILLSSFCSAIGVSPASRTVNYEPGKTISMDFTLLNKEGADTVFFLSSAGDLQESLFFENQSIALSRDDYVIPFKIALKMPAGLEPGIHTTYFKLTPDIGESEDMFRAFVSPRIPIRVRVPYPSKYAVVGIAVLSGEEGVPVPVNLEFDNLGSEDILSAGGSISLFGSGGALIQEMSAPAISIPANTFGKTEGSPRVTLRRGSYLARANAYYDDAKMELEENFSIGEPDVKVARLGTTKIYVNEINQVEFTATLDWDAPVPVSGFIIAGGKELEMPVFEAEPGADKVVTGYLDAAGMATGPAELTIRLVYASKIEEEKFSVRVVERGAVEALEESSVGIVVALAAVIAVMLFVIFWLMRHRPPKQGAVGKENSP